MSQVNRCRCHESRSIRTTNVCRAEILWKGECYLWSWLAVSTRDFLNQSDKMPEMPVSDLERVNRKKQLHNSFILWSREGIWKCVKTNEKLLWAAIGIGDKWKKEAKINELQNSRGSIALLKSDCVICVMKESHILCFFLLSVKVKVCLRNLLRGPLSCPLIELLMWLRLFPPSNEKLNKHLYRFSGRRMNVLRYHDHFQFCIGTAGFLAVDTFFFIR